MSGLGRLCVFVEKCFMQKESGWQNEGKKDGRKIHTIQKNEKGN